MKSTEIAFHGSTGVPIGMSLPAGGCGKFYVLLALVTSVHIIKHKFSEPWPPIVPCDPFPPGSSSGLDVLPLGCHGVVG